MAKRARGTTTRPGQRRPMQRPAARPGSPTARPASTVGSATPVGAARPAFLTPEEEARAAALEAAIVAEERQAEEARRNRAQRSNPDAPVRASSPLAVAAANEYAYVARDVRRVAMVGGTLVALLLALWVVTQVTGVTL
jgi:acetylornithine deacetylase/succinyl-diaminopimelate desuccinylase-like protein